MTRNQKVIGDALKNSVKIRLEQDVYCFLQGHGVQGEYIPAGSEIEVGRGPDGTGQQATFWYVRVVNTTNDRLKGQVVSISATKLEGLISLA